MVDKNVFLEELDKAQDKKDERIEELQQFKTEKPAFNIFDLLAPKGALGVEEALLREDNIFTSGEIKEIFSQREGLEKYGLNEETFEAMGGISGLAVATRAGVARAIPYVPSVYGKLLALILYDALGSVTGAQAFDFLQANMTGDELSFWEQLEKLPEDIKQGITWGMVGPMGEAAIQGFRTFLAKGIPGREDLVNAFNKSREYLGDRLAFSIADINPNSGPGKFIASVRSGFAQVPVLGGKLQGVNSERAAKLFELLGDFTTKLGTGLDEVALANKIFDTSKKSYKVFKKTMGKISDEIIATQKTVVNNGKVIPVNGMRDFLEEYVTKFKQTYESAPIKTTDPGYTEFYNFAERFLKLYPKNSKINYTGWKALNDQLEAAVRQSKGKPGVDSNILGRSFDEMRKLFDNANADDFLSKFPIEEQRKILNYIDQIKNFRQIYTTAKEPFERVVAGQIESVDDIFTALSGKFKGEQRKYIDELVKPLLNRMSPSAVDDLIRITGGDRKLAGEVARYWFDDAFAASVKQIDGSADAFVDTTKLLRNLGLDGTGKKIKGSAFKRLVELANEGLPDSQKIPPDYFIDLMDMVKRQQNINIPTVGNFLKRNIALGGSAGMNIVQNNAIAKFGRYLVGGIPGVISSILGIRGFSDFITSPDTLRYVIDGLDSTLPNITRKTSIVQFLRASLGELEQRSKDAAINTELKALNPAFNPDNIDDAKIKIQEVLDSINLFDQEEGETTPDVIDQIIEEIDSKKTPSDSNIFLDEIQNLEDTGPIVPSDPPQGGGTVTFSEPQVQRGDTGTDIIKPLSVPQLNLASISGSPNRQTIAGLESVGLPFFNAKDGGIVDVYKNFKRPQVVA